MIGNGVVPRQATAALRVLLERASDADAYRREAARRGVLAL